MKKNCTNCKHAEFEKTKSGRRNLDFGECKVEVALPHSFFNYRTEPPARNRISKHTLADCPLWVRL